jgi:hypothetical protein
MRLLPYAAALVGVLALVGWFSWFSWDARQPSNASRRTSRDIAERDDATTESPCPTPHWHNPGVDRF